MLEEQACFIGLYKYIAKILKVIDNWINEWIIHAAEGRFLGGVWLFIKFYQKWKWILLSRFAKLVLIELNFLQNEPCFVTSQIVKEAMF